MHKAWFLLLMCPGVFACAEQTCQHVGGGIVTNFLNSNTTFGSASGDLSGGIGVTVLSLTPGPGGTLVFQNQHHWVTTSGDTIFMNPAQAIAYPSGHAGLYAVIYPNGGVVSGGTGKFKGATGKMDAWGAVNNANGELSLRYEGTVCFVEPDDR